MKRALVCGAGGFIGSHLVRRLREEGYWVRGADQKRPEFSPTAADDFVQVDLREREACQAALTLPSGCFDEVYQLAADMGGMGFIHSAECEIMHNSALININMIDATARAGIGRYFLSSSVCIYRDMEPGEAELTEEEAFPALPDNEYGWEKLYAERMALAYGRRFGMPAGERRRPQRSAGRSLKCKMAARLKSGETGVPSAPTPMSTTWWMESTGSLFPTSSCRRISEVRNTSPSMSWSRLWPTPLESASVSCTSKVRLGFARATSATKGSLQPDGAPVFPCVMGWRGCIRGWKPRSTRTRPDDAGAARLPASLSRHGTSRDRSSSLPAATASSRRAQRLSCETRIDRP